MLVIVERGTTQKTSNLARGAGSQTKNYWYPKRCTILIGFKSYVIITVIVR